MLTLDDLRRTLEYRPDSGLFIYKERRGRKKPGDVAGRTHKSGYVYIVINRVNYLAHRLAWFYVNGSFPKSQIDHINRVRNDNRIENLREATGAENMQNYSKPTTNKSGVVGVFWNKKKQQLERRYNC